MFNRPLLILAIFLWSFALHASERLEGTLETRGSETFLHVIPTGQTLRIYPGQSAVQTDLGKLSTGDFISAVGRTDYLKSVAAIEMIEYVGLQKLLGVWFTEDWDVFQFRDFRALEIFAQDRSGGAVIPAAAFSLLGTNPGLRLFDYRLAPKAGAGWSLFLSNAETVEIGELEIKEGEVLIKMYDTQGKSAPSISLKPLRSPTSHGH